MESRRACSAFLARISVRIAAVGLRRRAAPVLLVSVLLVSVLLVSVLLSPDVRAQNDSGLPAPSARVGIASIWQKEVIDGKVGQAAREYEQLYSRGTVPADVGVSRDFAATLVERLRAAYRAGRCFEVLDNSVRAERAYNWLVREFERFPRRATNADTPRRDAVPSLRVLRDRAVVSLRRLDRRTDPSSSDPSSSDPSSSDPSSSGGEFVDALRRASLKDARMLERIRQEVLELRRSVGATRDLLASLARRGVRPRLGLDLAVRGSRFSPGPDFRRGDDISEGTAALHALLTTVTGSPTVSGSDRGRETQLRKSLLDQLWLRALAAAAEGRLAGSRRLATTVVMVDPAFSRARWLLRTLDDGREPSALTDDAVREAQRYRRELRSETRREARRFLAQAERWGKKRDRAIRMIARAHEAIQRATCGAESSDPDRLDDSELASLLEVTRLRASERAGRDSAAEVRELFDGVEDRGREMVELLSELVELFVEEWAVEHGAVEFEPDAATESGDRAAAVLREYRGIVALARRLREARKELELELAALRVSRLRAWFPRLRVALSEIPPLRSPLPGGSGR